MVRDVPGATASRISTAVVAAICVAPALLIIACRYPPFTDFPQHAAVASILDHLHDPDFDFSRHYELAFGRTLYYLPYALTWLLGKVVGVELALRVVVAVAAIAVPLGVLAVVRATGRPASVALLAVPLTFNQALFFGFHHFLLATGLALAGYALLIAPTWSRWRATGCVLLALASTATHVYGIALLIAMTVAHLVFGDRARLRRRAFALVPAALGVAAWTWLGASVPGYGQADSPPFGVRLATLPDQILGGYHDGTEPALLVLVLVAAVAGTWPRLREPRTWPPWQRTAIACLVGNLVLYFVLPQHTLTAKFIHFRHAILAAIFVPLAAELDGLRRWRLVTNLLTVGVATIALALAAFHFWAFQREASSFDAIIDAVPANAKVMGMVVDPTSDAVAGAPYLHFPAYVQAEKGGLPALTFPRLFWNLPVAMRADAGVPPTPVDFEWNAGLFSERGFGWYYDWAILRIPGDQQLRTSPAFPFELVGNSGRWQLYRRQR